MLGAMILPLLTSPSGRAQLGSCADVGCPSLGGQYSTCSLDGRELTSLGVTNFATKLSPHPFVWTAGYIPGVTTSNNQTGPDSKVFYLGQPPPLDLRLNKSVTACALFFNGIAPNLTFKAGSKNSMTSKETCDDALTAPCVNSWVKQAETLAKQSNAANFTCNRLAEQLANNPPKTCRVAKNSWGAVAAEVIAGANMTAPVATGGCNTAYTKANYSQTPIFITNSTRNGLMFNEITPVLSVIRSQSGNLKVVSEAHLSCLKPVLDASRSSAVASYQAQLVTTLLLSGMVALYLLL